MTYTAKDLKPIPQLTETGIPLLRAVWERIKIDSSAWNQGVWIGVQNTTPYLDKAVVDYIKTHKVPPWNCGTAYCVAGHVALAKGATLPAMALDVVEGEYFTSSYVIKPGGTWSEPVDLYAMELVGLDSSQASTLFAASNSPWTIECYIRALEDDPAADLNAVAMSRWNTTDAAGAVRNWKEENGFA